MKTVLVGKFENGIMISGKPSKIVRERCHMGIKEIELASPNTDSAVYRYQRPSRVRIGDLPRVMDPYEKRNVYIGDGTKDDGVFAKRNITKGELVLYYSGLIWNNTEQALFTLNVSYNQTWDEVWKVQKYLLVLKDDLYINIPEQYWSISNYRASLAHKLNHSFKKTKVMWGHAFHPRFGHIKSVVAQENIKRGEEIFIDYGYRVGSQVPKWFSDLYLEEIGKNWYGWRKYEQPNTSLNKNNISLCETFL